MTKPGKSIRVARSVVTDISIDPTTGVLRISGVDQGKEGQTLQSHQLEFSLDQLFEQHVSSEVEAIRHFAARQIDDA